MSRKTPRWNASINVGFYKFKVCSLLTYVNYKKSAIVRSITVTGECNLVYIGPAYVLYVLTTLVGSLNHDVAIASWFTGLLLDTIGLLHWFSWISE